MTSAFIMFFKSLFYGFFYEFLLLLFGILKTANCLFTCY